MNPNDFIDDDVHEAALTRNWNGSSSQVSQPPASLGTRLQNLFLTAPVSTPEVSSLHEESSRLLPSYRHPPSYTQHLYRNILKQIVSRQSRGWKPVSTPKVPSLHEDSSSCLQDILCRHLFRPERLLQAKERTITRISPYGMGSTSFMSSFHGAHHEVNCGGKYILE
ncbi:hypothetical protein TNIN_325201 [Trichonephila inaurata madagascariensis]|uniref:Uncharacterized protein n=1 Tax=Trichonephila inaurata madagascariensis TaxID=2747483 RepID=A0A8X6K3Q6_9ARAC|nr:hypothetical protein TNIN_325201 [Trichonephila inaurata madagascariensis]